MNMIVKTNVKLNLGLSVLRKRADGFHDIETLFVPCFDFGDTLEIITGDDYSHTSAALFAKYGRTDGHFGSSALRQTRQLTSPATGKLCERHDLRTVSPADGKPFNQQKASVGEHVEPTKLDESANDDKKVAALSERVTSSEDGRLVQGISEDGKLMITIAREEGVDWNPLKDLCAKAYGVLAQDFDLPPVKIFLEKKAPVGAGLGGGSADAAFTLKALNELCGLGLDDQRLSEYAARLGSDCAFFIFNKPMFGSGRGEILEPYDINLSEYEIKVLIPEGVAVSTSEAYKGIVPRKCHFDKLSDQSGECHFGRLSDRPCRQVSSAIEPSVDSAGLADLKTVLELPVTEWKGSLVNDFEATVFKAHPELAAIKQSLYDSGAVYASMSGSGSALFALYKK